MNALILIAERDPQLLQSTAQLLQRDGHRTLAVSTAPDAVQQALAHRPDLILLSADLAGREEASLCATFKNEPTLAHTAVVLISSGQTASLEQARGLEAGADDYLVRLISERELLARIQALLRIKRGEVALRESERRYRAVFENSASGLYRTTPDGQILMANPALVQMMGYSSLEELAQRNLQNEIYVSRIARAAFVRAIERDGVVQDLETALVRKDGSTLYVQESAVAIRDPQGKTLYYEGSVQDITERVQAKAEKERRARLQEKLAALSTRFINLPPDELDAAIQQALELCGRISGAGRSFLFEHAPDYASTSNTFEWCAEGVPSLKAIRHNIPSRAFPWWSKLLVRGREVHMPDVANMPAEASAEKKVLQAQGVKSALAVSLTYQGKLTGFVGLDSGTPRPEWAADDVRLLRMVGEMVVNALEHHRSEQQIRQHTAQLEALRQVNLKVTSELDLQTCLSSIVTYAAELMQAATGSLFLFRPELDLLEETVSFGSYAPPIGTTRRLGEGLVGKVWETGQPINVENYQLWDGRVADSGNLPPASILGVPVHWQEQFLGVLTVSTLRDGRNPFTPADTELLTLFANQAAIAIHNARLMQETEQHLLELTFLLEISTALSGSLDLDQVLRVVAERITGALDAEACAISFWDHESDTLVTLLDYAPDPDWEPEPSGTIYPLDRFPASRSVLESRQSSTMCASDPTTDPGELEWMSADGIQSVLMVPLVAGDQTIGMLEVMETKSERNFTPDEIRLCQTIANLAATTLTNAQLFEETQRYAARHLALNSIIKAAAEATDLRELLSAALEQLLQATGLSQGAAWLGKAGVLRGLPADATATLFKAAGAAGLELEHVSAPLAVTDWEQAIEGNPVKAFQPWLLRFGVRASLMAPLHASDLPHGGLVLMHTEARRWSDEETALVQACAQQLEGSIQRIHLLEQTRVQAQQVQQIINTVPEGVFLLDASKRIVLANPAAERYLGLLHDTAAGQPLTHLGDSPIEDLVLSHAEGPWQQITAKGRTFEVGGRPVEAGPSAGGSVLIVRDVTREREMQQRVEQHERLAAVGQLAAGMAHDFNNIMAVILLYAEISTQAEIPAAIQKRLATIIEQSKRASELINQVLDFSRSSVLERRHLNLETVLKEQVKLFKRTLPETIRIEFLSELGDYTVDADLTRLQQVIMNLAVNARDAMPSGGRLRFVLSRTHQDASSRCQLCNQSLAGEWVRLQVSDTGTGIPPEVLPHIFEPFFTTKAPGKGSGLGLAQVYGIVIQHNGHLAIETESGRGTTFSIYLPPLPIAEAPPEEEEEQQIPAGSGQLVLVVEDDPAVQEVLVTCLESLDYHVLCADNGVEAWSLFQECGGELDLVISDLVMPEMGGLELARALTKQDPALPIVLLTGYPLDERKAELESAGSVTWLSKPVDLFQLARLVHHSLRSSGVPASPMGGA